MAMATAMATAMTAMAFLNILRENWLRAFWEEKLCLS